MRRPTGLSLGVSGAFLLVLLFLASAGAERNEVASFETTPSAGNNLETKSGESAEEKDGYSALRYSQARTAPGPLGPTVIGSALSYFGLDRHLVGSASSSSPEADGAGLLASEDSACGATVQQRFNCSEAACEDLVPGYINYLDFFYCEAPNTGARIFAFLLLLIWGIFLLHLVESTTNDFFCASLTLAVDALKLSPNVAGVTFLAVGNAACDVIASIAAFATNSPKVGVGTTLGAGIFVTCAVIAVVSFVSDVRLARRSFVRDILFFILTVVYLLIVQLDGTITIGEAWGFVVIYVVFVSVVAGGRYIRALRNHPAEEAAAAAGGKVGAGESFLGVTGEEGFSASARRLSAEIVAAPGLLSGAKVLTGGGYGSASLSSGATGGGYNSEAVAAAAGLSMSSSTTTTNKAAGNNNRSTSADVHSDMLAALDAARSFAAKKNSSKGGSNGMPDLEGFVAGSSPNLFAPSSSSSASGMGGDDEPAGDGDDDSSSRSSYDDEEDMDNEPEEQRDEEGDLGGGSGHPSTIIQEPSVEDGGMAPATPSKKKSGGGVKKAAPDSKGLIKAAANTAGTSSATKLKKGSASKMIGSGGRSASAAAAISGSTSSSASATLMADLPKKPSRWTRQFLKTQKDLGSSSSSFASSSSSAAAAAAYQPFQWTKYHKKQLAIELGNRLRARGASIISTPDGRTVDFIDLLTRDPKAAGELAAAIGTAVTAAAQQQERALSYEEASRAAASGARAALLTGPASGRALSTSAALGSGSLLAADGGYAALPSPPPSSSSGLDSDKTALLTVSASGGISGGPAPGTTPTTTTGAVAAKSSDYLSILPHETIKPIADCYLRLKRCWMFVYPFWHRVMLVAELPVTVARKLTVPTMHEGAYRRRLLCLVVPFSFAFFVLILTTHILKGSANTPSGFPYWLIGFIVGGAVGVGLHFYLPLKHQHHHHAAGAALSAKDEEGAAVGQSLLSPAKPAGTTAATAGGANAPSSSSSAAGGHKPHHHHHHQRKRPWYKRVGIAISGPNDHPLPKGVVFAFLLLLSFVLALFWLLVIANEIVGTALFIGKVLSIPDVVMGLTVLAVGNSINDLAASLTIARDGYASMAVAGAYAGPMFNVLAGIGLPMIIACSKAEDGSQSYAIGKPTLLTFLAYAALLTSLMVTLVWVPFEQWRITHRIGRFLCFWFFLFVGLVVILGFSGASKGDTVSLAG